MTAALVAPMTEARGLDVGKTERRAALAAAGMTVGGIVTLAVFFAVGEPWGSINDGLTIALAVATAPIAVGLARRNPLQRALVLGGALDIIGVGITAVFTSLLIARRMTFEGSLPYVLLGQGLIGAWLVSVGIAAWPAPRSRRVAAFGIAGGAGLIVTVGGFGIGGMSHPLASMGFVAGLIGTVGFYLLLGRQPRRAR